MPLPELRPEQLIALAIPLTYLAMVAVERLGRSGRDWPAVRHWELTGVTFFMLLGFVNSVVGGVCAQLFADARLLDGRGLGTVVGGLIGYLLLSLGNAGLHRAYHCVPWLWRHVHRLHHQPARLGVAGVMYQTPWEMAANALLFVTVTVFVLRLSPAAAMLCAWLGAFYGMFQHFNVRTPRWLGLFIQRPEAHAEHHRYGVHALNYSDLPLWDMLVGSWRNPRDFHGDALGFGQSDP